MMILLSPSKSMNMDSAPCSDFTQPAFLDQSKRLVSTARKFSKSELMDFMRISENLAELNHQRFKNWSPPFTTTNAKPALFAFTGNVYDGVEASTLTKLEISFAQNHLRILSGLYGILKPLDLIQPYRLEMGRPLQTSEAKNLYEFWRSTVTEELNHSKGELIINLASVEYFKVLDKRTLKKQIISPIFKDEKNGTFKIISFFAKKARGSMARYLIENQITEVNELNRFAVDGYRYNPDLSTPTTPTFTRAER